MDQRKDHVRSGPPLEKPLAFRESAFGLQIGLKHRLKMLERPFDPRSLEKNFRLVLPRGHIEYIGQGNERFSGCVEHRDFGSVERDQLRHLREKSVIYFLDVQTGVHRPRNLADHRQPILRPFPLGDIAE